MEKSKFEALVEKYGEGVPPENWPELKIITTDGGSDEDERYLYVPNRVRVANGEGIWIDSSDVNGVHMMIFSMFSAKPQLIFSARDFLVHRVTDINDNSSIVEFYVDLPVEKDGDKERINTEAIQHLSQVDGVTKKIKIDQTQIVIDRYTHALLSEFNVTWDIERKSESEDNNDTEMLFVKGAKIPLDNTDTNVDYEFKEQVFAHVQHILLKSNTTNVQ
jgi:hypothetical protein